MSETLLCKECVHSFKYWHDFFWSDRIALKCKKAFRPEETKVDPVTGPETVPAYYERCGMERITNSKRTSCGEEAQFWQPKHKSGLFKLIKKEHNGQ
jgi:hypothetical protein